MGTDVHSGHASANGAASPVRNVSPRRQGLRRLLATRPSRTSISVIVVCHNEKEYLERTLRSLRAWLPPASEVIVIDDQSTDGCCDPLLSDPAWSGVRVIRTPERLGVSRSRNFGAAQSRGDILVFSDAHCEAPPGWASAVVRALQDPVVGAVSPAISVLDKEDAAQGFGMRFTDPGLGVEWLGQTGYDPYPVPLLCGCFIALRRDVFVRVGGFDPGMLVWGSEDMEFSLHLWSRGYECRVLPGLAIAHRFSSAFLYPVHWEPLYNKLRMGLVHLGPRRCLELISQVQDDVHLPAVWDRLTSSDVWARKQNIQQVRVHDDTWFFEKFADAGM
jgi:GT2 family glycosyltransferase